MSSTRLTTGESTREVGDPCRESDCTGAEDGAAVAEPTSEVGLKEEGADSDTGSEKAGSVAVPASDVGLSEGGADNGTTHRPYGSYSQEMMKT